MQGEWQSLDDAALMAQLQKGKRAAFDQIVSRHERSLINFFYHLSWNRSTSEDCAQEVFLRLYSHSETYQPQAKFTTFLFRIARNLWIDRIRSEQSRGRPVSLEAPAGAEADGRPLRDRLPGGSSTPVDILARRETEQALHDAIERLPEEQRLVVVLSEIQGLKYQEIAEILSIPVGTVKSRMHVAMEKLRDMLLNTELEA